MADRQAGFILRGRIGRRPTIWRGLVALALGIGFAAGPGRPGLAQGPTDPPPTSAPAPTDVPPPATNVPQPPPATSPPQPTARPPDDDDDDDDEQDRPAPAPAVTEPAAATFAPPVRTLRPTRTPRTTATLTPTPFVAGALRLTLASEAGAGAAAAFRVSVINQGEAAAQDLTLDIVIPPGLSLDPVTGAPGQTARAGDLLRWYIPSLDPGAETSLRLGGEMALTSTAGTELCVTLLSAGAPLEHCARFDLSPARDEAAGGGRPAAELESALPTAEPAGTVASELPAALRSGWTLILVGLAALGAWLGLQWRGGRSRSGRRREARDKGGEQDEDGAPGR